MGQPPPSALKSKLVTPSNYVVALLVAARFPHGALGLHPWPTRYHRTHRAKTAPTRQVKPPPGKMGPPPPSALKSKLIKPSEYVVALLVAAPFSHGAIRRLARPTRYPHSGDAITAPLREIKPPSETFDRTLAPTVISPCALPAPLHGVQEPMSRSTCPSHGSSKHNGRHHARARDEGTLDTNMREKRRHPLKKMGQPPPSSLKSKLVTPLTTW